jgi:TPR repeat protein
MNTPQTPGDYLYEATQLLIAGETNAALRYFVAAAEAGDADAQVNAGYCFETGTGTWRSDSDAQRWYRAAIQQRSGAAAFNLATMHRARGNTRGAIYWFQRAIALGDDTAGLELGRLCLERLKQRTRAIACLRRTVRGQLVAPDSLQEAHRLIRHHRRRR